MTVHSLPLYVLNSSVVCVCDIFIYFLIQVFDFELSDDDMKVIESFNKPWRACIPMTEVKHY